MFECDELSVKSAYSVNTTTCPPASPCRASHSNILSHDYPPTWALKTSEHLAPSPGEDVDPPRCPFLPATRPDPYRKTVLSQAYPASPSYSESTNLLVWSLHLAHDHAKGNYQIQNLRKFKLPRFIIQSCVFRTTCYIPVIPIPRLTAYIYTRRRNVPNIHR